MKRILTTAALVVACLTSLARQSEDASDIRHEKAHQNFSIEVKNSLIFSEMADRIAERNGYPTFAFTTGRNTSPADSNQFDRVFNFPTYGLGVSAALAGTLPFKSETGYMKNIYNLYGFFETDFVRWEKFAIGVKGHIGIGFTEGVYNPFTNPDNEWIGSRLLIYYGMGPSFKYCPVPNWEIGLDIMLWHHSNGRMMLPNWGINEFGLAVTSRYYMDSPYRGNSKGLEKEPFKSCFVWDIFGGAEPYMSFAIYDAFRYENEKCKEDPSYQRQFEWPLRPAVKAQLGVNLMWKYSRILATGLTVEGLYYSDSDNLKKADRVIADLHPDYITKEQLDNARYSPFYGSVGITQELQYRRVIVFASLGVHIGRQIGIAENLDDTIFYQSLGGRYLLPGLKGTYLSFACKVRKFSRADNLELCIGKRF